MGLACYVGGGCATRTTGLGEVVELALLADRYEAVVARDVLEAAAIRSLTVHSCALLLDARSSGASLSALSAAARAFALRHFEELAATDWILRSLREGTCFAGGGRRAARVRGGAAIL
jgi:hypothetical protein